MPDMMWGGCLQSLDVGSLPALPDQTRTLPSLSRGDSRAWLVTWRQNKELLYLSSVVYAFFFLYYYYYCLCAGDF